MEPAIKRLEDYLAFKGIPRVSGDLLSMDLRGLGFDDTDMATLIGEIQCDLLRVVDWNKPVYDWRCLSDILDNLTDDRFSQVPDVRDHLFTLWEPYEKAKLAVAAGELEWPS